MKLPWLLLIGFLASAGGRATAADLAITAVNVKSPQPTSDPNWQPAVGEKATIECRWDTKYSEGQYQAAKFYNGRGRFMLDGKQLPVATTADFDLELGHATMSWIAVTGIHKIGCEIDYNKAVAETNEGNNRLEIVINVRGAVRAGGNSTQSAIAGAIIPSTKSKSCKSTIYTTVQLDKAQFSPIEGLPEANPAKMTLDLVSSAGLGNYVHCEYQSVGKDVKLVYTFQCANAHQSGAKHIYACD